MDIVRTGTVPADIITLQDAKAHARVDFDDDDEQIEFYALAATDWVEDVCQTKLFRSQFTATGTRFRLSFDGYPNAEITNVRYVDVLGVTVRLDDSRYEIRNGRLVVHDVDPAEIGTAVVVFDAGLGADKTPPKLLQAIRMLAAHFYLNRESAGEGLAPVPMGVREMVALHRSFAF